MEILVNYVAWLNGAPDPDSIGIGERDNIMSVMKDKVHPGLTTDFMRNGANDDWPVEPAVGLGPTTYGLQNRCSTR